MIPKVIHYCWFGGIEKPKLAKRCINSWKKLCSDYEIIEWNESNFDVYQNAYTTYLYDNQKYAFLSDYARLKIIYENGGLYFDTDVELIKSPDSLLIYGAFYGFENDLYVASGLGFGAEAKHITVRKMLDIYDEMKPDRNGVFTLIGCPIINTTGLELLGLKRNGQKQFLDDVIILPEDFLNPYDDPTGMLNLTDNTLSIHWYAKSWMSKGKIIRSKLTRPLHRILGKDFFRKKK